ncbi:helix-turn-helix domain-containing protein [Arthrobacter sp. ERGS1:01]|uniref:helix-turn-helix domain-containing protein n=1 Tax=Arthrobacter sp. ERGS1:01 TaxID=1704044 RepID=UPI000ACE7DDC
MLENEDVAQYLTPADLSVHLQISLSTLGTWRSLRKGPPFYRMGGLIRYHPEEVATWAREQATSLKT